LQKKKIMAAQKKPRVRKNIVPKPQDAGVFIDPRTDFGFKRLFGEKDLMIDFLNSVLDISIVDLEYRNTVRTGASIVGQGYKKTVLR